MGAELDATVEDDVARLFDVAVVEIVDSVDPTDVEELDAPTDVSTLLGPVM